MKSMLISVVMTTCNGARYLASQLESILSQTYGNLEIIISDDKSDDDSLNVARQFAAKDKRIKVFSNASRVGVAAHFLSALQFTQGEAICFSDQDDSWRQDKIEILAGLIGENEKNMLAYSDLEICDEFLNVIQPSFWKASGIKPLCGKIDERILIRNLTPGCSMLFRQAVKDKIVKFGTETPFMHDHLVLTASCTLGEIVFTPEKLVKYRQHASNVIGHRSAQEFDQKIFCEQLKQRIDFFGRYGSAHNFNLPRLKVFAETCFDRSKSFGNLADLKYFFAMSPESFKYRLPAIIKCIFPGFYALMRDGIKGEDCR